MDIQNNSQPWALSLAMDGTPRRQGEIQKFQLSKPPLLPDVWLLLPKPEINPFPSHKRYLASLNTSLFLSSLIAHTPINPLPVRPNSLLSFKLSRLSFTLHHFSSKKVSTFFSSFLTPEWPTLWPYLHGIL